MKILLTGATGFIGRAVLERLVNDGHELTVLTHTNAHQRTLASMRVRTISAAGGFGVLYDAVDGQHAVINLAGEKVFAHQWSRPAQTMGQERLLVTDALVETLGAVPSPPKVFIAASAVGIYGDCGDRFLDENSILGNDDVSLVSREWERAALGAQHLGIRVVIGRLPLVLSSHGGLLGKMLPSFRAGVGGTVGTGTQYWSWIHLHDLVEIFVAALSDTRLSGPVNFVAPNPIPNSEFAQILSSEMRVPSYKSVAGYALQLALGDAAAVLRASLRVQSGLLEQIGFTFRYREIGPALRSVLTEPR